MGLHAGTARLFLIRSMQPIRHLRSAGTKAFRQHKEQLQAYRGGINITPALYDRAAYAVVQIARQSDTQLVDPAVNLDQTNIKVTQGRLAKP